MTTTATKSTPLSDADRAQLDRFFEILEEKVGPTSAVLANLRDMYSTLQNLCAEGASREITGAILHRLDHKLSAAIRTPKPKKHREPKPARRRSVDDEPEERRRRKKRRGAERPRPEAAKPVVSAPKQFDVEEHLRNRPQQTNYFNWLFNRYFDFDIKQAKAVLDARPDPSEHSLQARELLLAIDAVATDGVPMSHRDFLHQSIGVFRAKELAGLAPEGCAAEMLAKLEHYERLPEGVSQCDPDADYSRPRPDPSIVTSRRIQIGGERGLCDGGERAKVAFHEASHATGFLLRNHGDKIRVVEIADEGKTLSGNALGHVIFGTVPKDVEVFATVAALAGTALRSWSAWGSSADFEQLIRLGAIERGATLDTDNPVWMLREPNSLRVLRESVEAELKPVYRFIELVACELYAVGRMTGEQVCAAWSTYQECRGTISQSELFA